MYAATFTGPQDAYPIHQCAKFMSNPGPEHSQAGQQILQCLAGRKDLALTFMWTTGSTPNVLMSWADSDRAGDPDTRRSVTRYVLMQNGGAVSFQSVRQHVRALQRTILLQLLGMTWCT
jgi:hypothetical protein